MPALIPFWVNAPKATLDRLDARWKSKFAQAKLKNPWQIVKIDGVILPGLCEIEKVEQKLSVYNPKKSGSDGGRPIIRGRTIRTLSSMWGSMLPINGLSGSSA